MSNGFYFVPQTLYDLLEQQAQGDVKGALKKIVEDFIKSPDINAALAAYKEPEPYNPKVMMGDDYDYPSFWRHVDKAGRDSPANASRDTVMSAALMNHFNPAAKHPAAPKPQTLTTLHISIEQGLYAELRKRALATGMSQAEIITSCIKRYLAAPTMFEPLITYKVGDTLTTFHYHATADIVEALNAAVPAHPRGQRARTEARDIASLALAADFRREEQAAAAARIARANRALLGVNKKFKIG